MIEKHRHALGARRETFATPPSTTSVHHEISKVALATLDKKAGSSPYPDCALHYQIDNASYPGSLSPRSAATTRLLATIKFLSFTRVARISIAALANKEGNRARWRGRASNPVGGVSRSRVGSTPAAFRHSLSLGYYSPVIHQTPPPLVGMPIAQQVADWCWRCSARSQALQKYRSQA